MSHTGHSSKVASRGASSHSTFESDAEAPSQGVTPLVTHPATPDSRDGNKSHRHCSPKGKVIPEKKDEAKHKDEDCDSTSAKRSHSGKGGKHGSSKDGTMSPLKHTLNPTDSPSWRKQKEPQLEASPRPTSTQSHAPSLPKDVTDMDEQPSFLSPPNVTSTSHKVRGERQHSMSIGSIPSMMSFDPQLYLSFSYIGSTGVGPGSMPTLSLSGSQRVTSSGFCLSKDKSSHLPPITRLSRDQAAEIYQLVTECQELQAEVAQKFQHLSTLKTTQRIAAQATAHETINAGCMTHEAAGIQNMLNPDVGGHKRIWWWLTVEANQVWKDTNDILLSHQLRYDAELMEFITETERILRAKHTEIGGHVTCIAKTAHLSLEAGLHIVGSLPTIPMNLCFCHVIPILLAYCPESYSLQTWDPEGDGDYLLDADAWVWGMLSKKQHTFKAVPPWIAAAPAMCLLQLVQ